MQLAALLLGGVVVCAIVHRVFLRCARNQRAHFVDRPDTRRSIVYQALPTTNIGV